MRPIIGITMGDPFGNGPEISVKALSDGKLYERARPLVIGDYSSMIYAAKVHERLTGQHLDINVVEKPEENVSEKQNKEIQEILIIADSSPLILPCGACLQRIAEFATPDTLIHLADMEGIKQTLPLSKIFPASFTAKELLK